MFPKVKMGLPQIQRTSNGVALHWTKPYGSKPLTRLSEQKISTRLNMI